MSSPKLPLALPSISLHTTTQGNPGQLRSLPNGWKRQKTHRQEREMLASPGSLQSVKQFQASVSSYCLTCTASSYSRRGRQHLFCNGPPVERKGEHPARTPSAVMPHQMSWWQGHSSPKDSSTSQTWGWGFTSHSMRGSFSTLPRGWFWEDMASSMSSKKVA